MWGKFLCILMNLSIISLCDSYLQVSMLSTTHPRGCWGCLWPRAEDAAVTMMRRRPSVMVTPSRPPGDWALCVTMCVTLSVTVGCGIQSLMTLTLLSHVTLLCCLFSSFLFVDCRLNPDLKTDHRVIDHWVDSRCWRSRPRSPLIVVQLSSFQIEMREDS